MSRLAQSISNARTRLSREEPQVLRAHSLKIPVNAAATASVRLEGDMLEECQSGVTRDIG